MRNEEQKKASRSSAASPRRPGLLSTENPEAYDRHVDGYINRFRPIDGVERDLVYRMIAAAWREKRVEMPGQEDKMKSAARSSYTAAICALKELQGDRFNRPPSAHPVAAGNVIPFRPRTRKNINLPFEPKQT